MFLTGEEKFVIGLLAHPVFNVKFVEKWQAVPSVDSKGTVLQEELNGFMAAVCSIAKPHVQHSIYRKIDAENKLEDIKLRMEECFSGSIAHSEIMELCDDDDFLQSVYARWEKSLGWTEPGDAYWETCDDAIKEVLKDSHISLD